MTCLRAAALGGVVVALALTASSTPAWSQSAAPSRAPAGPPPPGPEVQAAMRAAEAGDPKPLVARADAGDVDAQYYAGVLYIFGAKSVAPDPPRGCAYEQKASARRADAMHLVGMCHQNGAFGPPDKAKAEAAFTRATEMGFPKSKCALGRMLMEDPARAQRGIALCKEAAAAGDVDAEAALGDAYFAGTATRPDHAAARRWYAKAAANNHPHAVRRLGEMYARGDGGRKDTKKALELWTAADKAGDPLVAILVADQLFADLTGGRKPGPGVYRFEGGVPVADIEAIEDWYRLAEDGDPRTEVKARARYARAILTGMRTNAPTTTRPH